MPNIGQRQETPDRECKSEDKIRSQLAKLTADVKVQKMESIALNVKKYLKRYYNDKRVNKDQYKVILKEAVSKIYKSGGKAEEPERVRKLVSNMVHLL